MFNCNMYKYRLSNYRSTESCQYQCRTYVLLIFTFTVRLLQDAFSQHENVWFDSTFRSYVYFIVSHIIRVRTIHWHAELQSSDYRLR